MTELHITRQSFRHEGGSKEYHLILLENEATQRSLFVMRFGKTGTHGTLKFEDVHIAGGMTCYKRKLNEKVNRGYTHELTGHEGGMYFSLPIRRFQFNSGDIERYFTNREFNELKPHIDALISGGRLTHEASIEVKKAAQIAQEEIIRREAEKAKKDELVRKRLIETDELWGIF